MSKYLIRADMEPLSYYSVYPMWDVLDEEFGVDVFSQKDVSKLFGKRGWRKEEISRDFDNLLLTGYVEKVKSRLGIF